MTSRKGRTARTVRIRLVREALQSGDGTLRLMVLMGMGAFITIILITLVGALLAARQAGLI
ncbi:hypothetical protein [Streptomyces sp. NPDC020965]|uniref:hypothetical protein n=1 Tax=Streptomyces sp. NPDC020965 TaxID=3365105 RepID=UPI0037B0B068